MRIFVSYRPSDSLMTAQHVYERLKATFGPDNVFKTIKEIPLGRDLQAVIMKSVRQSDIVLIIMGQSWLSIGDSKGQRRIDYPDDPARIELETAISQNMMIVPVLINGATMPTAGELPESVRALAGITPHTLPDDSEDSLDELVDHVETRYKRLDRTLTMGSLDRDALKLSSVSTESQRGIPRWAIIGGALLALVIIILLIASSGGGG